MGSTYREVTPAEVQRRVVQIVSSHLGVRQLDLHTDAHLQEQLGADLLDRIELAVTVEEEFAVHIPLNESMQVKTVRDIIQLVIAATCNRGSQLQQEGST